MLKEYRTAPVKAGFKKSVTGFVDDSNRTLCVVRKVSSAASDAQSKWNYSSSKTTGYYLKDHDTGEKITDLEINWKYLGPKNYEKDGYKFTKGSSKFILRIGLSKATLEKKASKRVVA